MGKVKTVSVYDIFSNPPVFIIKFGAGAIGAGAASLYGSSSTKMMPLLAARVLQHCLNNGILNYFLSQGDFIAL
jgi:hypothetical protein